MSQQQQLHGPALAERRKIPIRLERLKRAPALTVIGLPELIGLAGAALLALITIFAYFFFYLPAHSRLASAQLERDRLQTQLRLSEALLKENTTTSESVDQRIASVKDFEGNWLAVSGPGRLSLYAELNNLIRSNGLRNTAGPSYSPLEPVGSKSQVQPTASAEKQSNAKWQTIYPGIAVSVTVEGPYQSVRHFVRDIETSRHFLIINAVELEGVTQSGVDQALEAPIPPARTQAQPLRAGRTAPPIVTPPVIGRGALVSLRLDLATYFQRPETRSPDEPAK
jgi:Type II secretion system (T2SS), protein M subtype b